MKRVPTGWDHSAEAWLAEIGDAGDWARRFVLDRVMLARVRSGRFSRALDIGAGEGRFCRMLAAEGIAATGIEPTARLRTVATQRDPAGTYLDGVAAALPFGNASFDLVVAYLVLIDVDDHLAAIREMARVLAPGGRLLIANLAGFNTAGQPTGWAPGTHGRAVFAIDRYLQERPIRAVWRGIDIRNWHRSLSAYMQALIAAGLVLTYFDEPAPEGYPAEDEAKAERYRRVPYFVVMEWQKPEES